MAKKAAVRQRRQRLSDARQAAWGPVRDVWERVGFPGCAVGVVGVASLAYWVTRLASGVGFFGFALGVLLPLVAFVVCWRHPSLPWLMLIVLLGAEGVWIGFAEGMRMLFE